MAERTEVAEYEAAIAHIRSIPDRSERMESSVVMWLESGIKTAQKHGQVTHAEPTVLAVARIINRLAERTAS